MYSHFNKINNNNGKVNDGPPRVIILEQPSRKGLRFRYECEKKYATPIVGVNSTDDKKTFPTIKILNWKGPVWIVVSCVTKDPPYRSHPHNLLGKIKVADGICQFKLEDTGPALCFENLSVQCVKKNDVAKSLDLREKLGVDPFKTGFDHATKPNSIDLYSLRLCIEVFLEGKTPGVFDEPLQPVVTDPINDRRCKSEPEIVYLTRNEGSVSGGEELGILCERADRDDVDVLFYRTESNWEEIAQYHKLGVFKRVAIVIITPPYEDEDITEPVEVKILLRRRSTGDVSNYFSYTYLPGHINPLKRKRDHYMHTSWERMQKVLEQNKDQVLPKNMDCSNAFNLPARESKDNDHRELLSVTDLFANPCEYSDRVESTSKNFLSKNKNCVNNFFDVIANGPKDAPEHCNYSNSLNSDDWIHELLQTIEGDSIHNNKDSEIVKEPEIKYITPDPMPNISYAIPAGQNHNNFIANKNNNQRTSSINIPHFIEKVNHLPEHFATDLNTLANIQNLQEQPSVGIPQGYLMHGQHPQYVMNINENQWNNALNNVTNSQSLIPSNHQYLPAQPANTSQMFVHNNFNGHSSGNYTMTNGPFNQENTWHQIQRSTLNEFDPFCPTSGTWRSNQHYNDFTQ